METRDVIKNRRSVRKFEERMVEREKIQAVIDAGLCAASGMDAQESVIIAITKKALRDTVSKWSAEILGKETDPFYGAPVILIVLSDRGARPTFVEDGSLVLGNMMLAAYDLGLGSCWIHRAREEFESNKGKALLKELGISGDYVGVGHLALGYPAETPSKKPRKPNRVVWAE